MDLTKHLCCLCLALLNTIFRRNDTPKLPFWSWLHYENKTHSHVLAVFKVESDFHLQSPCVELL